jgi:alkylation response protein AidB-like acyl-CoA dehydrogenase
MERTIFEDEHEMFRGAYRAFLEREMVPRLDDWDRAGIVSRDVWKSAGAAGFLGYGIPEDYGGGGANDFRYNLVVHEECCRANAFAAVTGMSLHTDVTLPYFLHHTTDEQKARWLPGIATGELITAVAMTEPGIGSDLAGMSTSAIRDGDCYVVNGSKTFITNGINADLVIVAVKTDPSQRHKGMSLLVVERGMDGFERGRNLDKIGMHCQDTAELFFNDVRVPAENLLGTEGTGFAMLVGSLPQERLNIACVAIAHARTTFAWTVEYCRERAAFGQQIGAFQNSKFRLAEMATELEIGQTFVDRAVLALNAGQLTAEEAAMAKWWCTELQKRVSDTCVQLHGGYGYMLEYPVARAFQDGRVSTIYGGTTEIMKEVIGRSLGF